MRSLLLPTDTTLLCHLNGCVKDGMYMYSPHLMALDSCKPVQNEPWHGESPDHHFFLQVEFVTKELHGHPDQYFTNYIRAENIKFMVSA